MNNISGYSKIWNDSKRNNVEMGGVFNRRCTIAINTDISENTTTHCHLGQLIGCKVKGKYQLTLNDDSLLGSLVVVAPVHTHMQVNMGNYVQNDFGLLGMFANFLHISDRDINVLNSLPNIEHGLIIAQGVIFKYFKTAKSNNDFCRMYDIFTPIN